VLQQVSVDSIAPNLKSGRFTGGVQAGYNWQYGFFVLGIEADINYVNLGRTETTPVSWLPNFSGSVRTVTTTASVDSNYVATLRPRIGIVGPYNTLFYATGGFALSDLKYSNDTVITNFGEGGIAQGALATYNATSSNKFGYVVGGGFEYAWSPHATIKAEYQHLRFDIPAVTGFNPLLLGGSLDASSLTSRAKVTADIVRIGFNYKLGIK